MRIRD